VTPQWRIGDLWLTEYPFMVLFGTDYGSPDLSPEVLISFLTDGDLELTPRSGNRTLTLPVGIDGADLAAASQAEAALALECAKPMNTLYCDPGDGFGEPFQFTVFRGNPVFQRDDDRERSGFRVWEVTWRALSWPEATEEVTVSALAATGTTTTGVDDMSSTSGWTGAVDGAAVTPTVSAGVLTVSLSASSVGSHTMAATRTGVIDTSSTNYLVLDWRAGDTTVMSDPLSATADGVALPLVASQPSPTPGYTRSWFDVAAPAVSVLTITARSHVTFRTAGADQSLKLGNLDRSDERPTLGSAKQQLRTFTVAGSAPTTGSISVEHATTSLGDVLFYTCADDGSDYTPVSRPYHVSGTVTSDATAVSGAYDTLSGATPPVGYSAPYASVPAGEYLVMSRMATVSGSTASASATFGFFLQVAGSTVGTNPTLPWTGSVTGSYELYRIGMVHLPTDDATPSGNATVRWGANFDTGSALKLDEVYLFNLSTGRLSQVACGTGSAAAGGPANRLWIDSPDVDNDGLGRYLMGHAADRSDAYTAYSENMVPGVHEFPPGPIKVFTMASNPTTAVDVSYHYRPAGHSSVYSGL
jgi:hypothetical protein